VNPGVLQVDHVVVSTYDPITPELREELVQAAASKPVSSNYCSLNINSMPRFSDVLSILVLALL
jgi:hypothetical protein